MPSLNETVLIEASPDFVWSQLTDTTEGGLSVWQGVQKVRYYPSEEPLHVGQEMILDLRPSGVVVATCSAVDEERLTFSHTIDKAPYISRGWFGVELVAEQGGTEMQISGELTCSRLGAFGMRAAMPLFRANFNRIGQTLSRLAANQ